LQTVEHPTSTLRPATQILRAIEGGDARAKG
jgi:hypothetical protein